MGFLTACGTSGNNNGNGIDLENDQQELAMIDVELQAPEALDVGQEGTFTAIVTQGGEAVDDADEVTFEVWQEGQKEESEMIEAEHGENGSYILHKAFDQAAIYHIQSHVTARGMHTMPVAQLTVGEPNAETEDNAHDAEHQEEEEDGHHDHASAIEVQLHVDNELKAHEEQQLSVQVVNNGEALTDGRISLEIKHETEQDDAWIDLEELDNGEYSRTHTFSYTGTYSVNVHVRKDDLHDHKAFDVTVK